MLVPFERDPDPLASEIPPLCDLSKSLKQEGCQLLPQVQRAQQQDSVDTWQMVSPGFQVCLSMQMGLAKVSQSCHHHLVWLDSPQPVRPSMQIQRTLLDGATILRTT